jgi:hypothetical protein
MSVYVCDGKHHLICAARSHAPPGTIAKNAGIFRSGRFRGITAGAIPRPRQSGLAGPGQAKSAHLAAWYHRQVLTQPTTLATFVVPLDDRQQSVVSHIDRFVVSQSGREMRGHGI